MLGAGAGSSRNAFGGSGIPVFGVHALSPTNSVADGDSFFSRHDGYTPVPDGATNTCTGIGVVLVKGTGPSSPRCWPGQATETTEPQPRLMFSPPAGDAAANPYTMVEFGTSP